MKIVTLCEAQANLADIVHRLNPNEQVIVIEGDREIARIIASMPTTDERKLGTMRGTVLYMAPDFDAPLDGFS